MPVYQGAQLDIERFERELLEKRSFIYQRRNKIDLKQQ